MIKEQGWRRKSEIRKKIGTTGRKEGKHDI